MYFSYSIISYKDPLYETLTVATEQWILSYNTTQKDPVENNKIRHVFIALKETKDEEFLFSVKESSTPLTRWEIKESFKEALKKRKRLPVVRRVTDMTAISIRDKEKNGRI